MYQSVLYSNCFYNLKHVCDSENGKFNNKRNSIRSNKLCSIKPQKSLIHIHEVNVPTIYKP